jgi:hypothetical protein
MSILLRSIVIFALIASGLQNPSVGVDFSTEEGAKSIIENVVLGTLPNPIGDLVTLVKNSPEIVKGALIVWLNRKMADAATEEDWTKFDRYSAFYDCFRGVSCDELKKLQNQPATDCNWGGSWDTNRGEMTLQQSGNTVTGSYTADNGRIQGTASGKTLKGTWCESSSCNPPKDAGEFTLAMSDDCSSFDGSWCQGFPPEDYGETVWEGYRIGTQ